MYMNRKGLVFGSRDCYDLRTTLGKINANAIRTFRDTIEKRDKEGLMYGLPCGVCEINDDYSVKDWQAAKQKWFDILDAIIYAFEDNEPCPRDYYNWVEVSEHTISKTGSVIECLGMVVDNAEGEQQYEVDLAAHREKVDRGLKLFAEFYSDFWF